MHVQNCMYHAKMHVSCISPLYYNSSFGYNWCAMGDLLKISMHEWKGLVILSTMMQVSRKKNNKSQAEL